ncbi:hypothetical protein A3715_07925 [Oleiphilus sp. HI0009]|nr:hypothetical protein A3715_21005 [Oleiphilus sp. HI0009]KZX80785.1 hypothetical protein A3715_07925 [Oleiphilus sp. HI0009]
MVRKSKRVLLVIRWPVGGIRTYLRYVFQGSLFDEYEFVVIVPSDSGDLEAHLNNVFRDKKLRIVSVEPSAIKFIQAIRSELRSCIDIVHAHGFTAGLLSEIARLRFLPFGRKAKLIVTTHDVFLPNSFVGFSGTLKKVAMNAMFSRADVVNPCGFDAAENVRSYFPSIDSNKILPIRNGILVDEFEEAAPLDFRGQHEISDDTYLFGFFSRFMNQKGFDLLRDAVLMLRSARPQLPFKVICLGSGGYIREEQAVIHEKSLSDYFVFAPASKEMPAALRGVDLLVIPSRWEACPLLPMEALVSGTPCLVSDCVGMREVSDNTPAKTFKSGDVQDLFEILLECIDDLPAFKTRCQEYKSSAKEEFSSELTSEKLARLYKDLTLD